MKQMIMDLMGAGENRSFLITHEGDYIFPKISDPIHPSGATFIGWSLSPDGPILHEGDKLEVYNNFYVYARWSGAYTPEGGYFQVQLLPNGALGKGYSMYGTFNQELALPKESGMTHPLNYDFLGWAEKPDEKYDFVEEVTLTKNITLYAIWAPDKSQEWGLNYHRNTGRFVKFLNFNNASSIRSLEEYHQVDSMGRIQARLDHMCRFYENSSQPAQLFQVYYNNATEATVGVDQFYTLQHPEDLRGYYVQGVGGMGTKDSWSLSMINSIGKQMYVNKKIVLQDIQPEGIPLGKQFLGYSTEYNSDVNITAIKLSSELMVVPVFREGDPQYSVTLDANDGTGDQVVFNNIPNEAFRIDYSIKGQLAPLEGKILLGYSLSPEGEPIFDDYILIYGDTTLYAIWGEEDDE